MLSGRRAYDGETVSDMVARILEREPDWTALPATTPPRLVALLKRCMTKDAKQRQRDIGDVRLELEAIASGDRGEAPAAAAGAAAKRGAGAWRVVAIAATLVAAVALALFAWRSRSASGARAYEFTLDPPEGYRFDLPAEPNLSQDGRMLACAVVDSQGTNHLAVRELAREEFRVVPGTDGATLPFWSPDGGSLGYFLSAGHMRRIRLDGSAPVDLDPAPDGRGGTWSRSNIIVFAPTSSGPLFRRSASGGEAVQVTRLDASRHEVAHRYPRFLPDGSHFLYVALTRDGKRLQCIGDVSGGPPRLLGPAEKNAIPAGDGWLATAEGRHVHVQRFDERSARLEGESAVIAACGVNRKLGNSNLAADANGTIVYQAELRLQSWARWFDYRTGTLGPRLCAFDTPRDAALAPDGRRLALVLGSDGDLWLSGLGADAPSRLTFFSTPQASGLYSLAWSHDSRRIAYTLEMPTTNDVVRVFDTGASRDTALFQARGLFANPIGWSADGGTIALLCSDSLGQFDPWSLPVEHPERAACFATTPEYERSGPVAPDGHWAAVEVTDAGRTELRVYSTERAGVRFQLSTPGRKSDSQVLWSADGKAIVTLGEQGNVLEIPVSLEGGFRQGQTRTFARLPRNIQVVQQFVTPGRLLVLEAEDIENPAPLRVLTAWRTRLEQR
jgi:Tol biopolymer transport system component